MLRNLETGREIKLPVRANPRFWLPGPARKISARTRVPSNTPPGVYATFLSLPDPEPRLYGRPEYSIRLANKGLWEPKTGYNRLRAAIRVSR